MAGRSPRLRVIVADQQALFGELLEQALTLLPIVDVIGRSALPPRVLELVREHPPDIVIIDIGKGQLDLIAQMHEVPGIKLLVLTDDADQHHLVNCLQAGVAGYLVKSRTTIGELNVALQTIASGNTYISPAAVEHVIRQIAPFPEARGQARPGLLTAREREVLRSLAMGTSTKEIARDSGISHKTVRNHISHMYRKLGTGSRAGLVLYAIKMGIVDQVQLAESLS